MVSISFALIDCDVTDWKASEMAEFLAELKDAVPGLTISGNTDDERLVQLTFNSESCGGVEVYLTKHCARQLHAQLSDFIKKEKI